ncbi:hypothetical protein ACH5RR_001832 [Cinchona calisaya]|uniref:SHSP domain-containing protein n=1 Tax=Cinchona calisaya TaxID=153742 RepID=A0ABD3B4X9_9GENT
MDETKFVLMSFFVLFLLPMQAPALMPYWPPRSFWDIMTMFPQEDPSRILEQSPSTIPKSASGSGGVESLALLAHADWKETAKEHVITLDIPGIKKEEIKIEVEDNRVLKVSGERKIEEEEKGDKWHRAERTVGKFWRQFRLPANADLDNVNASLENGVLEIVVPKLDEVKKQQTKVISIADEAAGVNSGVDVKPKNDELK